MPWSRRIGIALTVVILALTVALVACASVFRASEAAPALPRIAPAVAQTSSPHSQQVRRGAYSVTVAVSPNRSTALNSLSVRLTRNGRVVSAAKVTVDVRMLEMAMPGVRERLRPAARGRYTNTETALGMVGRWGLRVEVAAPGAKPFSLRVVDYVSS